MTIRQALTVGGTVALLAVGVATLPACSGAAKAKPAGPAAAVASFERALAENDCSGVKKVVVGPEQIDCGLIAETAASMDGVDLDAATYTVIDSGDDTATVRADFGGAEKQDLDLVRAAGVWLVIFDTAA